MPSIGQAGKPKSHRYTPVHAGREGRRRQMMTLRAELGTKHGTIKRVAYQLGYGQETVRNTTKFHPWASPQRSSSTVAQPRIPGVGILSFLITFFTFGIALPYAVVLQQRWKAKHTLIGGRRLEFVGSGTSLFLSWIKWLLLILLTLGIYGFWVMPRVTKWIVENTDFDDAAMPAGMAPVPVAVT
jgi:uncharacterized membrane protein YjgN (DUF898 family)